MALRGKAFIIMWHDIAPESEAEYHQWHTREHMPERLGHRGFLRSRRGVNWGRERQRYFTLYEGEGLETFVSEDYSRSLNHPTEWTTRVAPTFRNFRRMACEVLSTRGAGVGGAFATFRLALKDGIARQPAVEALVPILDRLAAFPSVTGVHLAGAAPDFSEQETRETELRPAMSEPMFDLVIVVEGIGLREMEGEMEAMAAQIRSAEIGDVLGACYDMAYMLEREPA